MAKTQLQNFTAQEKLNKMDMDMINVIPVISAGVEYAALDWLFAETEIPNCVSSPGASCLLQQIGFWDFDGDFDDWVIDLLFFKKDPGDGIAAANAASALTKSIITTYDCLGIVRLSGATSLTSDADDETDINYIQLAPVGIILKADTDSTSIWVAGINVSGAPTITSLEDLHLQFGVVKD